jgi:hypothetical protein
VKRLLVVLLAGLGLLCCGQRQDQSLLAMFLSSSTGLAAYEAARSYADAR